MVEREGSIVYGSVIQRCLIPKNLGVILNIATVPIYEMDRSYLDSYHRDNFRHLVSQIMGIPSESIIDDRQYQKLTELIFKSDFWYNMYLPKGNELSYYYYRWFREYEHHGAKNEFPDKSTLLLANHTLSLFASPTKFEFPYLPLPYETHQHEELRELNFERETFELGTKCLLTSISPDKRVQQFVRAAWNYEIPSGQSPETESDSLLTLFENSKKVCLAPLGAGGAASIPLITQGSYVAALLTVGTGAAATLVLIGTVSVADYLVYYLLHKRNEFGRDSCKGEENK